MINDIEPLPDISLAEFIADVAFPVEAFLPQLGLVFSPSGEADIPGIILADLSAKAGLLGDYNTIGLGINQISDTVYAYNILYVKKK